MSEKDRRKFFKDLAASTASISLASPLAIVIDSMLAKALADANSPAIKPRRLISFQQPQAPARWAYDLFLTPYMTDAELSNFDPGNPMIRTRYQASGGLNQQLAYATTRLHGINVPTMWGFDVPNSNGGDRPTADLLPNMLSLQGINTTNAGHTISRYLHYLPGGASQSTSALASDYADLPLGTLGSAANFGFRSKFGKTAVLPGILSGNYLTQLLQPFILALASSRLDTSKAAPSSLYQRLNRIVDDYAKTIDNKALPAILNKASSHELMLKGFANLTTIWNSRIAVYNQLVKDALDQTNVFPGFNDYPIGSADPITRGLTYAYNSSANILKFQDLNELFQTTTVVGQISSMFVCAEYLILNDLSNSVCLALGSFTGLKTASGKNTISSFNVDQHQDGSMVALMMNFWSSRALSACMLELIDQLKGKTVAGTSKTYFDETVIEVHGDFQRNPRADASGSDHGFLGKSVMYLSGAIDGPHVIGALGRAPANDPYPGAWGLGTVDPVLNKHVTNADAAATLANLLRVPNPFTTTSPMAVLQDDGSVTPIAIKTRIVT
jgi:hypothetical protein